MLNEMFTDGGFGFQWHITGRCAGKCLHCYQSGGDGGDELPVDALKRIAEGIMEAVPAPVTINITGGEPLIYQFHGQKRGVFELMSYLSTFDNIGELNIITSTRGMDRSVIHGLRELPKLTYVKVSLESGDPLVDDNIRGLGHYKMARANIEQLIEADLPVVLMATLSKRNYQSVSGLCALAAELGSNGVIFERFVPLGQGVKEMADCVLTSVEWEEILSAIAGAAGADAETLRPYRAFWVDGDTVSGAPCCLGPTSMALMPDGTVYPCRRVPAPVGKLPDDGMGEVLKRLGGYSSFTQKCFDFDF